MKNRINEKVKAQGEEKQLEVKKQAEELKASIEIKNSSIIFADKNIQDNLKTIENAKNGILNLEKKIDDCKLKIESKLLDIKRVEEEKEKEKEILKQILEEVSGLNQSADEQLLKRSSLRKELEETKLDDDGTYKIEASLGTDFDYKKSYKFEFVVEDKVNKVSIEKPLSRGIPIHAMFEKFFEYWGIKSFEISEDGSTLILNGNIKISGSNKLLKDL